MGEFAVLVVVEGGGGFGGVSDFLLGNLAVLIGVEGLGGIEAGGFVDDVIEELAPRPEIVGGSVLVGREVDLGADRVADGASTGSVAARWAPDAVFIGGGEESQEVLVAGSPLGASGVVADAVDGAEFVGQRSLDRCRAIIARRRWVFPSGSLAGARNSGGLTGGVLLIGCVVPGAGAALAVEEGGCRGAKHGDRGGQSQE